MIEPGGSPQPPARQPPAAPPAAPPPPGASIPEAGLPAAVLHCFDAVPAMLWALEGPQLRVIAANAGARASVDDRTDLLGAKFRDVLPEPDTAAVLTMLEAAFASGEPAAGEQRRLLPGENGEPATEGVCTWTVLPTFHADGSVRGLAVHVVDSTAHAHALAAAEQAAVVAERRYREVRDSARDAALDLRRTLLPSGVPVLARLRVAAQYRVAEHAPAAGGDWFDALPLGDGRVALLVGDVSGHGATAAGAMGQLRAVAVEALMAGEAPATVLARLDRFAALTQATRATTLCLVILDQATGELVVGSHAHPAPLVVAADGSTRFLAVEPGWPLGTGGPAAPLLRDRLVQGELLLLYTDGLVERQGRRLQDTMGALARVAASTALRDPGGTPAAGLADRTAAVVLERLAYLESFPVGGGYRDDVTLVVAHLRPPLAPLVLRLAAAPGALAQLRHRFAAWLDDAGVTAADAVSVLHAMAEAATNVLEHAYAPGAEAWVELRAQLTRASEVRVTVRDGGAWRDPATGAAGRGRGMLLMRELVDDVAVRSDAEGTTVTLTQRVQRPAVLGAAAPAPSAVIGPEDLTVEAGEGCVRVAGPVDAATAGRLRAALLTAGRGGPDGLVVDLTGVTQLASAGVHVLHELAAQDAGLRLVAPPDRPAHAVLVLTGLTERVTVNG
jgi:serine phosphatase RsbU (regulator of sigma subunit)/anti-sigma regulatory factor (Ser/Thr protein kinase)/anti-anti-sigma regulatory factor